MNSFHYRIHFASSVTPNYTTLVKNRHYTTFSHRIEVLVENLFFVRESDS